MIKKITPFLILMILLIIAFFSGKQFFSVGEFCSSIQRVITGQKYTDLDIILWQIRLPRILTALLVGASLSVAGSTYQGMFKNPLVSPDILGVSVGASLGAVIAIYFNLSIIGIQMCAFLFGLITVLLVYAIAQLTKRLEPILAMVLAGISISAVLASAISLIKLLADPYSQLTTITFWMMGSLTMATMSDLYVVAPIILICLVPLFLLRWRMNLMSLDDEEISTLGINIRYLRIIFIFIATLITSATVSITGIIGWIGLVIPHLARLWQGPDFRHLLPTSICLGAGFLLVTDTIARSAFPIELPLGILTAFIGAPFFLGLLIKGKTKV